MSTPWINVLPVSEVPSRGYKVVTVSFISILIGNSESGYFAIENMCTHDGGDLEGGPLEGEEIVCPRHGAGFCLKTGKVTRAPAYEDIRAFPLRIENGYIQIQV